MNFFEVIDPGLIHGVPYDSRTGKSKDVPLSVTSGTQYTVLHGLGLLPRAIFVAMADNHVTVKTIWRNATHCLVSFSATANLILRVE
jgi:hypothetical protein